VAVPAELPLLEILLDLLRGLALVELHHRHQAAWSFQPSKISAAIRWFSISG